MRPLGRNACATKKFFVPGAPRSQASPNLMNPGQYFIWRQDKPEGPFTRGQLLELRAKEAGLFWAEDGDQEWKPLSEFPPALPGDGNSAHAITRSPSLVLIGVSSIVLLLGVAIGMLMSSRLAQRKSADATPRILQSKAVEISPKPAARPGSDFSADAQQLKDGSAAQVRSKAEAGDAKAQYVLARMCYYGEGVEKNLSAAVKWWRLASEQGDADALNALGLCYERGEGIEMNLARAYDCYSAAVSKGSEKAKSNISILEAQGYTKAYLQQLNSQANCATPEGVVKAYLNAATLGKRMECVRLAPETKPLMEKHYSILEPTAWPVKFDVDSMKVVELPVSKTTAAFKVLVNTWGGFRFEPYTYYVLKVGQEYKVDWEASMGINPMTLIAFKVTKPSRPQVFRLIGRLSDYYNYEFQEAKSYYYSIRLQESSTKGGYEDMTGYVQKHSKDGEFLFNLMSDGAEHPVAVELRYLPNNQSPSVAVINRVVGDGWFIP